MDRLKSRKDDMLTLAAIGVDQLVIDEIQKFRKLSFANNQTTLKDSQSRGLAMVLRPLCQGPVHQCD
jgi:N12 class adenine-specific DNA methylase